MSTGVWIMPALGAGLNYGLLAYFISVAIKNGKERTVRDSERTQEESYPPTEESAVGRCY